MVILKNKFSEGKQVEMNMLIEWKTKDSQKLYAMDLRWENKNNTTI